MVGPARARGGDLEVSSTNLHRDVLDHLGAQRSSHITDLERGRIDATIGMIPPHVTSILDVGSGDGRIAARLAPLHRVVSVDYSEVSARKIAGRSVCADSGQLPFRDGAFDLVLCCEVLEHLPDDGLRATISEMKRTTRKYLLVSVPYKEKLRLRETKCQRCGTVFHIWGHRRRFSSRSLDRCLGAVKPLAARFYGEREPYCLESVAWLNQRVGDRWADFDDVTICPTCGNRVFDRTPRNTVTMVCGLINRITSWVTPVLNRNWIIKLYACEP